MAAVDAPAPEDGQRTNAYIADQAAQARKRTSIGLAPHRPTARTELLRPPDAGPNWLRWLLVFFLVLLLVAIMLLLAARFLDPATAWPPVWPGATVATDRGAVTGNQEYVVDVPGYALWLNENFARAGAAFLPFAASDAGTAGVLPERGVYRMEVEPGQLVWSLVDMTMQNHFRLETGATVDLATPQGAVGVIARFDSPGNFYLFDVDGAGGHRVELWREGQPYSLQSAASSAIVSPAGAPNRLGVEDDGDRLRFYANQVLVFEVVAPLLPSGRAGIAVRSTGDAGAAVDFDWLLIYAPETAD